MATSRLSDYEQRAENGRHSVSEWANEMVEEQPLSSLCAVFAAGFVLGVGVCSAIAASTPQTRRSNLPRMDHLSDRIADAVSKAMPKQLSDLWQR